MRNQIARAIARCSGATFEDIAAQVPGPRASVRGTIANMVREGEVRSDFGPRPRSPMRYYLAKKPLKVAVFSCDSDDPMEDYSYLVEEPERVGGGDADRLGG